MANDRVAVRIDAQWSAAAPGDTDASGARPRRAAVLVCHGMGQQVPFETLNDLARGVADVAASEGDAPTVRVAQLAAPDGDFIPRAELTLATTSAHPVEVHLFEAYWAPLTEGKIGLAQTLGFLLGAGWRGMKFGIRDGVFDRWMFGAPQEFRIPPRAIVQLFFAWWSVLLLSALFLVCGVFAAALAGSILDTRWPGRQTLAWIIAVAAGLTTCLVIAAAGGFMLSRASRLVDHSVRARQRQVTTPSLEPSIFARAGALTAALVIAALSTWLAMLVAASVGGWLPAHRTALLSAVVVAAFLGVGLGMLRWFLVEYAGDVAIYVSAYTVSRYQDTRSAIQTACRRVARFVYSAQANGEPGYDCIAIVGHSLGSVIAYDTLNDAINRDQHPDGWFSGSTVGQYEVVDRTRLLLTFGSPLDKTAFIFRTQQDHSRFEIREALATTVQPLILAPNGEYRPARWVNLWSRWDWVSGSLAYYDRPPSPSTDVDTDTRVLNVEARGSWSPGAAHTGYWDAPLMPGVVYAALTGRLPRTIDHRAVLDAESLERLRAAFPSQSAGLVEGAHSYRGAAARQPQPSNPGESADGGSR